MLWYSKACFRVRKHGTPRIRKAHRTSFLIDLLALPLRAIRRGLASTTIDIIGAAFDLNLRKIDEMLKLCPLRPAVGIYGTIRKPCLGLTDGTVGGR